MVSKSIKFKIDCINVYFHDVHRTSYIYTMHNYFKFYAYVSYLHIYALKIMQLKARITRMATAIKAKLHILLK